MRALLGKVRTRLGAAVVGASLLAVGGTATAAVVATSPASDSSVVEPTPTAAPTSAPAADATTPAAVTPAPTVAAVTTPEPAPVPATAPSVDDTAPTPAAGEQSPAADPGIGSTGPDGRYTPAPQQPKSGEPPVLDDPGSEPAPPVRGEDVTVLPAS